ncbi:MAG: S8 family serine peptidase [Lachnospiraceae bacterium]|nr:S8 family serine peptidase [Lachnospiraceae bacterium]
MRSRNRWLSMLLTVTMMTAQLPASPVIAAEDDNDYEVSVEEVAEEAGAEEETVIQELTPGTYVENRVVSFAADEGHAGRIAAAYNATLESFENYVAVINLEGSGYTVATALDAYYASDGYLPEIEPDYIAESCVETDDTVMEAAMMANGGDITAESGWNAIYSSLTDPDPALNPSAYNYQWYHDMIKTYDAWAMTKGKEEVVTAVISDGAKLQHEDLKGTKGLRYYSNTPKVYEHGTPLAGIIAANINNGKGGSGVAPNTKVMAINALDSKGELTSSGIAAALAYVAEIKIEEKETNGKKSYSLSLIKDVTGPKAQIVVLDGKMHNISSLLQKVIEIASEKRKMTIIAPAGEDDSEIANYPAAYENVIAVAAIDSNAEKTARSTYGDWVDLAAPGYEIYAPSGRGGESEYLTDYGFVTGSSAAAAMVAGVCALYMSAEGSTSPAKMKEVLLSNLSPVKAVGASTQKKDASVYPGKGYINAKDMLGGKDISPRMCIYEFDTSTKEYGVAEPSKTADISAVTAGSHIVLTAMQERTVDKKKTYVSLSGVNTTFIYTLNGKNPTIVKDETTGVTKTGDETYICSNGIISINEIIGSTPFGIKKVTLKAACVDGKGSMGSVTTMKLTTKFLGTGGVSINLINAPVNVVAGKKVTLKAQVLYVNESGELSLHDNQKVKWEILSATSASIDSKGVLKTKKGSDETITISCTPEIDSTKKKTFTVKVSSSSLPVKKIELNSKTAELDFSNPESASADVRKSVIVSVNSAVDKDGNELFKTGLVNFEWKSSKTSVATIEVLYGGRCVRVIPHAKGTAVISCKAMDGSNKTVKCKVKVKQLVTNTTIKGLSSIARGGKATYKASCTAYKTVKGVTKKVKPNNKKVTWSVMDPVTSANSIQGVNIDPKKGKLTVDYSAVPVDKEIYVVATANDNGHFAEMKKVVLLAKNKTTSVKIDFAESWMSDYYLPTRNKKTNSVKTIKMHSSNATKGSTLSSTVELTGITTNGAIPVWTSSNKKVVDLLQVSGNKATFVAYKTGTATITCDAADGSKKKATVKVNVIVPSSGIRIIDSKLDIHDNPDGISYSYLAKGGSTQLTASLGKAYGEPTITDVSWELEVVGYKNTVSGCKSIPIANEYAQKELKNKLFTLKNGSLSVNKAFDTRTKTYSSYLPAGAEGFAAIVYASTKDGAYNTTGRLIVPVKATTVLRLYNDDPDKARTSWTVNLSNTTLDRNIKIYSNMEKPSFTARSSDSSIVNAAVENNNTLVLRVIKEGKAEITVTANDGSVKTAKITIEVKK